MVFYVSLFIVCAVAAGLTIWMVRSLSRIGQAYYQAILPSKQEDHREPTPDTIHMSAEIESMAAPWGWNKSSKRPKQRTVPHPAPRPGPVPWGWPGNPQGTARGISGHGTDRHFPGESTKFHNDWLKTLGPSRPGPSPQRAPHQRAAAGKSEENGLGWPDREGSFEFGGQTHHYRVTGKLKPTRGKLVKPWGW